MSEIWKPIKGYEGLYEVSNMGRVKSLARMVKHPAGGLLFKKEKILSFGRLNNFYPGVALCKNGIPKSTKVHKLVTEAFIGDIPPGFEVNHKNGIKTDSNADNLEIVLPKKNINHAYETGLNPRRRKIIRINDGKIFNSMTDAAKEINGNVSNIHKACNGQLKTHKGFSFAYYN